MPIARQLKPPRQLATMILRPCHWLTPLAVVSLAACSIFQTSPHPTDKDKDKPPAPKLVGRIASIPADKRFVLIQSYGKWTVETGTILTSRGNDDRSANLRVTGEALGQFAAADLQSGTAEIGDAVYSRHVPQPPNPPPTTEPTDNQSPPLPEKDQKNN